VPNNATLVVVGDVETDEVLRRVRHHFGSLHAGNPLPRVPVVEPPQPAERRVRFRREGTTAYWRAAFHAPAFGDEDFLPMMFVDAVLSGAAGLNLWSGHKVPTPQRSARLYRAIVDRGLASAIGGALLPTEHPFLYYLWATVAEGQTLQAVEDAIFAELDRLVSDGVSEAELVKIRGQLRARFVYDSDSVTDIAHQLGYFETIAAWQSYHELIPRLAAVTLDQVNGAARRYLTADNRTVGWFEPVIETPQVVVPRSAIA
jgi:zinc protease